MSYTYDEQNIFAKILRGEIPSKPVFDDRFAYAFPDITPQRPTHILVIPKGPYRCYDHFMTAASDAEIVGFFKAVAEVAKQQGLSEAHDGKGYRLITNSGAHSHQEVPHFHVHLLGGAPVGPLVSA
ncbi:HIT-like protein [Aquimixticola soesokkakensis]|uniref:HIT-like protein n=1 Tax=Aquimixticola soesokkakensis TaxID=1519096 RepID=A0A1Y5T039_9RHOB|nr:HIT domain-containing protein [Aquimixticola soesokkakensis]SLN52317.1 HIT-like protein [Aquimixticola soesokkakensis]